MKHRAGVRSARRRWLQGAAAAVVAAGMLRLRTALAAGTLPPGVARLKGDVRINGRPAEPGFLYRLSGAVSAGSDTWGAITSCDSSGFSLTAATDTGKLVLISVNPADLPDGQNYVHVRTAATSYNSRTPATVCIALLRNRYSQQIHLSTT